MPRTITDMLNDLQRTTATIIEVTVLFDDFCRIQVLAVWRLCKASPDPAIYSIAQKLSVEFDKMFYDDVYLPMQSANRTGLPCMRPSEGTRCRVYDIYNHE
jgi:hypothetical protein